MNKQQFSTDEIFRSLLYVDLHCSMDRGPKKNNKIIFYKDDSSEGKSCPYLVLTSYKHYIKFTRGSHLTNKEKLLKFYWYKYDKVDDFVDSFSLPFIRNYFDSIKTIYVRK